MKTIYSENSQKASGRFEKSDLSLPTGKVSLKVSIIGLIHSETYIDNAFLGNCS